MKHLEEEDVQEIKSCILEVTLSKRFSEHDKSYLFCLVINSQETYFQLKVGDVKRFLLPCHVSYQIIPIRGQAITQYDIKPQKGSVSAKKVRVEIQQSDDISTITTTIRG